MHELAEGYRHRAEEAERHAARATSESERLAYKQIARGWRDLEAQERRRQKANG